MNGKSHEGIYDSSPFIAWIHNMSKNQMKYLNSRIDELNLGHEMRFIMMIYDNPNISQDDLVSISGNSKASIAKTLKKQLKREMKSFPKSDRFQGTGKWKSE